MTLATAMTKPGFAALRARDAGLLPAALAFQGLIVILLLISPGAILDGNRHVFVVVAQIIFGLVYLGDTIRNFSVRAQLITDCIEDG